MTINLLEEENKNLLAELHLMKKSEATKVDSKPIKSASYQVDSEEMTSTAIKTHDKNLEETAKPKKHWCVIDRYYLSCLSRVYFRHFPHALETLLPCWSMLRQAMDTAAGDTCGILSTIDDEYGPWQTEFIKEGMKCDIETLPWRKEADFRKILTLYEEVPVKFNTTDVFSPLLKERRKELASWLPTNDVFHVPNMYLAKPRFNHFHYIDDKEDAHALRRNFISDFDIATIKGPEKPIQIGIIQRDEMRIIKNLDELKRGIQDHFLNANVTVTHFNFKTVKEQASWFATKDIIVAAHGAALANSVFITPKTIVLILYPPKIMFQSLEPMVEQAGGIALDWFNTTESPIPLKTAYDLDSLNWNLNLNVKDFEVDVEEVVGRLHFATATKPTWHELRKLWKKVHVTRNNAASGEIIW